MRAGVVGLSLFLTVGATDIGDPGDLDSSFGGDGKVTTNLTTANDVGIAMAFEIDGKIVVGGGSFAEGTKSKFRVARYNPDGALDPNLSIDGKLTTNFGPGEEWVNGLTVQSSNGSILAVGGSSPTAGVNAKFAVARYDNDGTLDLSFSGNGTLTTNFTSGYDYAEDVVLQPDGKIVVAGTAGGAGGRFALARYTEAGTLDPGFGVDGKVRTNFDTGFDLVTALALQSDGKILAAGWAGPAKKDNYKFAVARYDPDGSLDLTFGDGDGKVTTNFTDGFDHAWDMALQSDGKIVLGGNVPGAGGKFALARYKGDGTLDTGFDEDGKLTTNLNTGSDVVTGLAVQGDGKIVAAGWSGPAGSNDYQFAVVRYETDGALDVGFSTDGKVTTDFTNGNDYAWDMGIQSDGNIVAVGRAAGAGGKFAVVRYLAA